MGRSAKSKDKRKAKRALVKKSIKENAAASKTSENYSIKDLLDKAEESIDVFNYDVAQKFLQRALEVDPDNLQALEATGSLCLEFGDAEAAKHCFNRMVELSPEDGHTKYMYLGQLCAGAQAAEYFQKGIELMTAKLHSQQSLASAPCPDDVTPRDISSAYLSAAELYMTDCCFDDEAEERCKNNIELSLTSDPGNPEAHQLHASFLMLKENKEGAREAIKKSVSLWLPQAKAAAEGKIEEDKFDPVEVVSMEYNTRITTAQILIELEEFELANDVLEGLLDENDEVVQTWYLIGWLNYLQGDDYKGNARYYLQKALELHKKVPCEDGPMMKHIGELVSELGPGESELEDLEDENMEEEILSDSENEQQMEGL